MLIMPVLGMTVTTRERAGTMMTIMFGTHIAMLTETLCRRIMMVMTGTKTAKLLMLVLITTLALTTEARDPDHDGDTSHTSQLVLASFLIIASLDADCFCVVFPVTLRYHDAAPDPTLATSLTRNLACCGCVCLVAAGSSTARALYPKAPQSISTPL